MLKPPTPRDEGFLRHLRALAPGLCPVTAYGALIPQAALEIPRHGWVNLHFSLLPAWRGAAPVAHAIAHGDEHHRCHHVSASSPSLTPARSMAW